MVHPRLPCTSSAFRFLKQMSNLKTFLEESSLGNVFCLTYQICNKIYFIDISLLLLKWNMKHQTKPVTDPYHHPRH